MKVLVVNNIDIKGGAFRAAQNIHKAYLHAGIDSTFFDYTDHVPKIIRNVSHSLDHLTLRCYPKRNRPELFSAAKFGTDITGETAFREADIINLHWINGGFISLKSLGQIINSGKPIVWTMHDFWPISGGCHLNRGCMKFTKQCGTCPVLASSRENDLSRKIWQYKNNLYQNSNMHWVAVSDWFQNKAKQSSLINKSQLYKITNAIDTSVFIPSDKEKARKELNLPIDRFIILTGGFGITKDPNKGFNDFLFSLHLLAEKYHVSSEKLSVVIFGNVSDDETKKSDYPIINAGLITDDDKLSKYYAAADVFICSSKQETGPTTILESMSCGTPVVSYNVGVVPEVIINNENGYFCSVNEPEELATGILRFYNLEKEKRSQFGENAQKVIALNCSYEIIGTKYLDLFRNIS